jgi:hypothetical protein
VTRWKLDWTDPSAPWTLQGQDSVVLLLKSRHNDHWHYMAEGSFINTHLKDGMSSWPRTCIPGPGAIQLFWPTGWYHLGVQFNIQAVLILLGPGYRGQFSSVVLYYLSGTHGGPSIKIDRGPGTLPTAGNWPTAVTSSLDPLPYLWSRYTVCYIVEVLLVNPRLENRMSLRPRACNPGRADIQFIPLN